MFFCWDKLYGMTILVKLQSFMIKREYIGYPPITLEISFFVNFAASH